jgi:hypothetical protein
MLIRHRKIHDWLDVVSLSSPIFCPKGSAIIRPSMLFQSPLRRDGFDFYTALGRGWRELYSDISVRVS